MSSIFKQFIYQTEPGEKVKVIDSNAAIAKKIEEIRKNRKKDEFVPGLHAEALEEIQGEENEETATSMEELSEKKEQILEEARSEAENILNKAENDAVAIAREAEDERIRVMREASEEGYKSGYEEGVRKSQEELETQMKNLQKEKEELEKEMEEKRKNMEPQLVDTILEVFSHVTHVLTEDKKDLILAVVNSALEEIEINKNFIIRVCPEDAVFLRENREKIAVSSEEIEVEITEDATMKKGQCMIDTELGVFDCSLDIQLSELIKDIKILACAGE